MVVDCHPLYFIMIECKGICYVYISFMLEPYVYHMGVWFISVDNVGWSVRVY